MLLGIPQSVATLTAILLYYAMDFALIHRYDRQRQASGSGRSWDFTLFIFAAVSLMVLQPIVFPRFGLHTDQAWGFLIQLAGVLTILIALALHLWSRVHLQQFYAERVEVQPEHRVIDSGPYALMRHPVITSFFGIATGLLLINPSPLTFAVLLYTVLDFGRAARQEEDLLAQTVPGYVDYARQTPRFLPRLWRNR